MAQGAKNRFQKTSQMIPAIFYATFSLNGTGQEKTGRNRTGRKGTRQEHGTERDDSGEKHDDSAVCSVRHLPKITVWKHPHTAYMFSLDDISLMRAHEADAAEAADGPAHHGDAVNDGDPYADAADGADTVKA